MKIAYVGGPYRADSIHATGCNIRAAEKVAVELWRMGWAVLCPHLNSAFLDGAVSDERFLAGGLAIMARCDALVLIEGWRNSKGATAEREYALALQIPVHEWDKDRDLLGH